MDILKFLKNKTWFTNMFSAVVGLAALTMLIVNPLINLDSNLEALWAGLLVSSVSFYRNENHALVKTIISKFAKDNDLSVEEIYKEEEHNENTN